MQKTQFSSLGSTRLRDFVSELQRRTIFPLYQRRLTPSAFGYLRELQRFEFASSDSIEKTQWERLGKVLRHAAKKAPYYRDRFRSEGLAAEDVRSPGDFARIPILTKSILQQHGDDLLAEDKQVSHARKNATGGSTGEPVNFYQGRYYWDYARASQWFVESWWGIRAGDRTAAVWGCDRDLLQQSWKERLSGAIQQTRTCNAFALTIQELEDFSKMLMRWRPKFLVGYASALEVFARFLLARPALRIRPKVVKSTAEVLTDAQRSLIEAAFQSPVCNFYGSREVNNLAAECPARQGMHVNSLARYIEIVDESGRPTPAGAGGRILVTDLTNFAMPFIRYEIGDIGSWREGRCDCGRSFPLLASVLGRSSDFISTPSGKIIHGEYFTHLFYDLPQVQRFQVLQSTRSELRVDVMHSGNWADFPIDLLRQRIHQAIGDDMHCDIRKVEAIDRTASGKHRFTISSVSIPWGRPSARELQR